MLLELVEAGHVGRMGRSAHADAVRSTSPRLHARGHPQFLRAHRRGQAQQRGRHRQPRTRDSRRPQRPCAARDGGAEPAEGRHRELSGGSVEDVDVINNPEDPSAGTRRVPFSRVLFIERDDFMEDPPKKFFRLSPGSEVRLRCAYFLRCTGVVKDPATGEIVELRATLRSGDKRRRFPRRTQGESDAPLGVGGARRRR